MTAGCVKANEVVLRCLSVIGDRGHFGHFMLDYLWPIYHWLYKVGRLDDSALTIYSLNPAVEKFRAVLNCFFKCRIVSTYMPGIVEGMFREMALPMEGHNRRILRLGLGDYIGNPETYLRDMQDYAFERVGVGDSGRNLLVLIDRKPVNGDVGGGRRRIGNHDEVRNALEWMAGELSLEFDNARLEDMTFARQVELFRNARIVVGQHGAAFANLFWMRRGSVIQELHRNDKENYRFGEICKFFGHVRHSTLVCSGEGAEGGPEIIDVPVDKLIDSLRAMYNRREEPQ